MSSSDTSLKHYPVYILEDRYSGSYSGGSWLAVSNATRFEPLKNLLLEDHLFAKNNTIERSVYVEAEANGDDLQAKQFWSKPPTWVASGWTPSEALSNLYGATS